MESLPKASDILLLSFDVFGIMDIFFLLDSDLFDYVNLCVRTRWFMLVSLFFCWFLRSKINCGVISYLSFIFNFYKLCTLCFKHLFSSINILFCYYKANIRYNNFSYDIFYDFCPSFIRYVYCWLPYFYLCLSLSLLLLLLMYSVFRYFTYRYLLLFIFNELRFLFHAKMNSCDFVFLFYFGDLFFC